jgi:hypothetical protein
LARMNISVCDHFEKQARRERALLSVLSRRPAKLRRF